MPTVIYIAHDGVRSEIDVPVGTSLMQAACDEDVSGITGECGGNALCATCHVYVDADWLEKLGPLSEDEDALLNGVADERLPNSRLSCQIAASAELDGIVVHTPERQS